MENAGLQTSIEIMSGPDDGRIVSFRQASGDGDIGAKGVWVLTLGRREDCDLCLPFDTQISRLHARLLRRPDGWYVEDGGSRNGTFIESQAKAIDGPVQIKPGMLFRIGRTWLCLRE